MPATKGDVLAYLQGLSSPGQINHRLLLGQFSTWPGGGAPDADVPPLIAATGQMPAMVGAIWGEVGVAEDLPHLGSAGPVPAMVDGIPDLIDYWNAGCLIQVFYFPASMIGPTTAPGFMEAMNVNAWGRFDPVGNATTTPAYPWNVAALTSGVATCAQWREGVLVTGLTYNQILDYHAAYLQPLKDAGVVVLWSPWHEFDGGSKSNFLGPHAMWEMTPADFITLWRYVYNYFTVTKGLTNLIWTWGLLAGDSPLWNGMAYYPGDDVVDVVGWSNYGDASNPLKVAYQPLVDTGKIVMLTEFGQDFYNGEGPFDLNAWVESTKAHMPKIVGAMAYATTWSLRQQTNIVAGMANAWVQNAPVPVLQLAPVASFVPHQTPGTRTVVFEDTSI